jgi:hypothetical protein
MYAVGGEVKIDISPESTPEATIRKMQQVRKAALAPAQPSSTDRAVAAQATQIEAQARIEKNNEARFQDGGNSPMDANISAIDRHRPDTTGLRVDILA